MGQCFDDLFELRVPQVSVKPPQSAGNSPSLPNSAPESDWIKGEFIRKVPLAWLARACRLPGGKALATALAIWFECGRRKRSHDLKLTSAILERFHVDRFAKHRALAELEGAGLIRVERQKGKNPLVTILPVGQEDAQAEAA